MDKGERGKKEWLGREEKGEEEEGKKKEKKTKKTKNKAETKQPNTIGKNIKWKIWNCQIIFGIRRHVYF